jgi:hypothetical protein
MSLAPVRRPTVFVGSAFVAQYPQGGGNFWVPLQYLLGLRDLGYDAWWLEYLWTRGDHARDRAYIETFFDYVRGFGVADRVVLGYFPTGSKDEPDGPPEYLGMSEADLVARKRDALLLNMVHSMTPPLRGVRADGALRPRSGAFQIWSRQWDMGVGSHDAHVTIGMNLGAPDSPIPLHGVPWARVWPAVYLPEWHAQPVLPPGCGAYTTVTQWWSNSWAYLGDEVYDCNKRGLPAAPAAPRPCRRADGAGGERPSERDRRPRAPDRASLAPPRAARRGGHARGVPAVRPGVAGRDQRREAVVREGTRGMDQRSHDLLPGERPAVPGRGDRCRGALPASAGLRFFRSLDDAVEGARAIEADYPGASKAARVLAEEVFGTRVTIPALLRAAGA